MASTVTIGASTVNVTVLRDEPARYEGTSTLYWVLDRADPVVSTAAPRLAAGEIVFEYAADLVTALATGAVAVLDSDCPSVVPDRTMVVLDYVVGPHYGSGHPRDMWSVTVRYQAV